MSDNEQIIDDLLKSNETEKPEIKAELKNLFENEEEMENFFVTLPVKVVGAWAENDYLLQIVCPPGYKDAIKERIESEDPKQILQDDRLVKVFQNIMKNVTYVETGNASGIILNTLRQGIAVDEVLSAHSWANTHDVQLYEFLKRRNLRIHPTMEELRILALLDMLLDIREMRDAAKVLPASRIPNLKTP